MDDVFCSEHVGAVHPPRCAACDRERRDAAAAREAAVQDLRATTEALQAVLTDEHRELARVVTAMLTSVLTGGERPRTIMAESAPQRPVDMWGYVGGLVDMLAGALAGEIAKGPDPLGTVQAIARVIERQA